MTPIVTAYCAITGDRIVVNDRVDTMPRGAMLHGAMSHEDYLIALYRRYGIAYPRFFRMDNLCKLAFVAAELLLRDGGVTRRYGSDVAVVLSNGSSSIDTDLRYAVTFSDTAAYFPSPALFVYSLPNVMIGELCIRHAVMGENALLIAEEFDPFLLCDYIDMAFRLGTMECCVTGWVELSAERREAILFLVEHDHDVAGSLTIPFDPAHLRTLYHNTLHDKS